MWEVAEVTFYFTHLFVMNCSLVIPFVELGVLIILIILVGTPLALSALHIVSPFIESTLFGMYEH